jgi:hypothetical protein
MIKKNKTRVFFVIDSLKDNEEIFETQEEALKYSAKHFSITNEPRLYIAIVENAYKEKNGKWNYDDCYGTFDIIKHLDDK